MEEKTKKPNILTKISAVLFGIFITSMIFAIFLRLLEEPGLWISLVLMLILTGLSFTFSRKGGILRGMAWGMLATLIAGAIGYAALLFVLFKTLS